MLLFCLLSLTHAYAEYLHLGRGIIIKDATNEIESSTVLAVMPEFTTLDKLTWINARHDLMHIEGVGMAQLNQYHLTESGGIICKIHIPTLGDLRIFSPHNKARITPVTPSRVIADMVRQKFFDIALEWVASKKGSLTGSKRKSLSLSASYKRTVALVRSKCGGDHVYIPELNAAGIEEFKERMIDVVLKVCETLEKSLTHVDPVQILKSIQEEPANLRKIRKTAHTAYMDFISLLNGKGEPQVKTAPLPDAGRPIATDGALPGDTTAPNPADVIDDEQEQRKKEAIEKAKREKFKKDIENIILDEQEERGLINDAEFYGFHELHSVMSEERSKIRAKESEERERFHEEWRRNYRREQIEKDREEERQADEKAKGWRKKMEEKIREDQQQQNQLHIDFFKKYEIKYKTKEQFIQDCRKLALYLHPDKIKQKNQDISQLELEECTRKFQEFNNLREEILKD